MDTLAAALLASLGLAAQEAIPVRQVLPNPLFDSAEAPTTDVSEIGQLASAYFVRPDRIVIADRATHELHFLDLTTGDIVTAAGRGEGPGEISGPAFQTVRTGDGVAVWDLMSMRMTHFSDSGVVTALRTFPIGSIRNLMAPLAAVFSDGAVVFRDGEEIGRPRPNGRYRQQVRYLEFPMNGDARVIAERLGPEEFHRALTDIGPTAFASGSVVFGHELHEAQAGDLLVVAQTDLQAVQVIRRDGSVAATVPLSEGQAVSAEQLRLARSGQATRRTRLQDAGRRLGVVDLGSTRSGRADRAPANDTTPPIGGLVVDLDGRLWMKSYELPDDSVVRWHAWRLGEPRPEFELVLPRSHMFLDAHGSLVLLHVEDDLGVDRVVVHDTGPGSELTLNDEPIFDSEVDLDSPLAVGWLDGALLLDSGRFAFVDGLTREIAVVDIEQRAVVASTTTSDGQLSSVRLLDRLLSGPIVVADQNLGTLTVYGPTLDMMSTSTFNPMSGRPVGMFPDGHVLFRREPTASMSPSASGPERRYRNQAVYDVQSPGGVSTEVARAMGNEMAGVTASAGGRTLAGAVEVIFGQRTLEARLGNCLVLIQTEWNEIKVIDRSGQLVASIPVASRETEVSQADVAARRQYRIRRLSDSGTKRRNMNKLLTAASQSFGRDYTFDGVESQWIMKAPANMVAPSIDKLVVDSSRRIWARLLSESRDGERWQLWGDRTAVVVKLPTGEFLVDAHQDQVLVRTEDNGLRIRHLPIRGQNRSNDRLSRCTGS